MSKGVDKRMNVKVLVTKDEENVKVLSDADEPNQKRVQKNRRHQYTPHPFQGLGGHLCLMRNI